jgi:hypothetical protein
VVYEGRKSLSAGALLCAGDTSDPVLRPHGFPACVGLCFKRLDGQVDGVGHTCSCRCNLLVWMQDGSSPLLAAVKGSHDSIVKAVLALEGVDVNAATTVRPVLWWVWSYCGQRLHPCSLAPCAPKCVQEGVTPLHDACSRGDTAIVKVLLGVPGVKADLPRRVRAACRETGGPCSRACSRVLHMFHLCTVGSVGDEVDAVCCCGPGRRNAADTGGAGQSRQFSEGSDCCRGGRVRSAVPRMLAWRYANCKDASVCARGEHEPGTAGELRCSCGLLLHS